MTKLFALAILWLGAAAEPTTNSYGIPFGELVGGMWHNWCYEDEEGNAANFLGIGGCFEGIMVPVNRAAIKIQDDIIVRIDYDPPANGIQAYASAIYPDKPGEFWCEFHDDFGTNDFYRVSVTRVFPGFQSIGPEARAENHYPVCYAKNVILRQYSVKYVD